MDFFPLFGQLVGIWKSHDKAQAKSLDDRGSVGYFLDIDIWQGGTARIMQDGIVAKGLAPKLLDPSRYHLNPRTDLNALEKVPVMFLVSPRHRDAKPPLAAALAKNDGWMALAKEKMASMLARSRRNAERVLAVQRACREASFTMTPWWLVGRDDLEKNVCYARCALKLVLCSDLSQAQRYYPNSGTKRMRSLRAPLLGKRA